MELLSTACACVATVFQLPSCGDALVCMPKCRGMQAPAMMRHACTDSPCTQGAQPPRLADYTTATMKPGRTSSTPIDLKQSSFLPTTRVVSPLCNVRDRCVLVTVRKGTSLAWSPPRSLPPHSVNLSRDPGRAGRSGSHPFWRCSLGQPLLRHQWVSWSGIQGKTG